MEKWRSCAVLFSRPESLSMQVQINGEARELNHNEMVLAELVRELDLAPQRIAVEVNKRIIRRSEWDQTTINDGDRIEIVHFVGGGSDYAGRAISLQKSLDRKSTRLNPTTLIYL